MFFFPFYLYLFPRSGVNKVFFVFFCFFFFIKGQTVNIFVLGAIWPLFLLLNCHGGMEVATDIT